MWREQVIAWAMEYELFYDRHYKTVERAWLATNRPYPKLLPFEYGPLNLFDGEPRRRLEALERKQALATIAGQARLDRTGQTFRL